MTKDRELQNIELFAEASEEKPRECMQSNPTDEVADSVTLYQHTARL